MKIKFLHAFILFAGFCQAGVAAAKKPIKPFEPNNALPTIIHDTAAVDSIYDARYNSITIPILDSVSGRYNTELFFGSFKRRMDGSYSSSVILKPLTSLNDSNQIVMDPGFDPVIAKKLEDFLKRHVVDLAEGGLGKPGAIVRVEMKGKVWRGVIGKKRINSDEPLNFSDRHRIGSLTKTFVDSTVMQLADRGFLDLDDTIDKYLPDVNVPNKDKITIRDLIAHRNGLYNYVIDFDFVGIQKGMMLNPLKVFKPEDLLDIANNHPINYTPDHKNPKYQYTNTGIILAGLIIEKLTGKPLMEAVHQYTVNRLGLLRTEFPLDPGIQSNYMHGHADYNCDGVLSSFNGDTAEGSCKDFQGNKLPILPAQEIISYLDPSASWAAGAMISNHDDLAKWMKVYVDGGLLKNKSLQKQMLTDCLPSAPEYGASYCLGIVKLAHPFTSINQDDFGVSAAENNTPERLWYGHLGQINGYDNAVFRNTAKDITVGMTNNNYFISTDATVGTGILIFDLLDIVDPLPAAPASTVKTNAAIKAKALPRLHAEDLGGQ